MVPNRVKKSQSCLARVLFQRQHATVLQVTPALVQRWTEETIREKLLGGRSHVRVLAFGGEACPHLSLLAKWKHPQVLMSKYRSTIPSMHYLSTVISSRTRQGYSTYMAPQRFPVGQPATKYPMQTSAQLLTQQSSCKHQLKENTLSPIRSLLESL